MQRKTLCMFVLFLMCENTSAYAQRQTKIGFLVVSTDPKLQQETLDDLTEAVTFGMAQDTSNPQTPYSVSFGSITKERVAGAMKYVNSKNHGTCFSDLLCVRQQANELKKEMVKKEPSLTSVELIIIELFAEENNIRIVARFGSSDLSVQGFEIKSNYLVKREFKELSSCTEALTEMVFLRIHPKMEKATEPKEKKVEKVEAKVSPIVPHKEIIPEQKSVVPEIKTDSVPTQTHSKKILFRVLSGVSGAVALGTAIGAGIAGSQFKDAQDKIDQCANEYCGDFVGSSRETILEKGRNKALTVNILAPTAVVMTGLAIAFWFIGDRYDEVPVLTVMPVSDGGAGMHMMYSSPF